MADATKHPWIHGRLTFTKAVMERVEEEARAAYGRDEESCGLLLGPAPGGDESTALLVDEALPFENRANKLHRLDPETYPRTGRMYFDIDPMKFGRAVEAGEKNGRPVKVLYHSHLDATAALSGTDAAVLSGGIAPSFAGGPATLGAGPQWPLAFMVTSVLGGSSEPRVDDHKLYVWGRGGFVASTFDVI